MCYNLSSIRLASEIYIKKEAHDEAQSRGKKDGA